MPQNRCPANTLKRILLAEDSTITQDILRLALTKNGHETASAHNAQEAINLLLDNEFDVGLIDFHLPDRNGYELVREFLRLNTRNTIPRMIALTGDAAEVVAHENSADYFDLILAKPFMISDLVDVVNSPDSVVRPASNRSSPMVQFSDRPAPLLAEVEKFHIIYFPDDFYGSFKNAVSMSIAKHGVADAIVLDAVPSEGECEMMTKIKGLGTAAHIDRTKKCGKQCDFSFNDGAHESEIKALLAARQIRRQEIHHSRHMCKSVAENLLMNLYLKNKDFQPTVNFTRAFGVTYNHILPGEVFHSLASEFVDEGWMEETRGRVLHRCPQCHSARLYPHNFASESTRQIVEVFCTDCQNSFSSNAVEISDLLAFSLTKKAIAYLQSEIRMEMI